MTSGFPKNVVFQSKMLYKYLAVEADDNERGSIRAKGEEPWSSLSKFKLEKAKTGTGLYHIRCCYSNKYVAMESADSSAIIARADAPNDNPTRWSSTLVELVHAQGDFKSVQLRLAYNRKFLSLKLDGKTGTVVPEEYSLYAEGGDGAGGIETQFTVINWDSLLNLPKYVVFKGDNGKYLRGHCDPKSGEGYLTFDGTDIGDSSVVHEVLAHRDGTIGLKPMVQPVRNRDVYWLLNSSSMRICISSWPLSFTAFKVKSNSIALRCDTAKNFCRMQNLDGVRDTLVADSPSITRGATLMVEEPVLSREISDVDFRIMHARIYDQKPITMVEREAINHSSTAETMDLKLVYTDTTSRSWDRSLGLKLGYSATIKAGIPLIAEESITMTAEFEGSYQWGDKQESSQVIETTHTVTVQPRTKVKARLLATRGKCDVPFSYTQRDVLIDGQDIVYNMDDGIYTGINSYNFKFETTEEKLLPNDH